MLSANKLSDLQLASHSFLAANCMNISFDNNNNLFAFPFT